jgi:8-oxo-dGTP pyrophosphatase MutT (NUDIX family)
MSEVFETHGESMRFVDGLDDERARSAAIDRVARELEAAGELTAWRDERYAVAPELGSTPWFLVERAAARYFGIHTYGAHVNGVVRDEHGVRMWLARRSNAKSIDPGMLDNLVGGGIAAGQTIAATVVKEAWEEAGIRPPIARIARPAGAVRICRGQPDGLHRETIFVHDLWLSADFTPAGQDGEVVDHRLVTLAEAARLIAEDEGLDAVTADASLVILDFLIRHGHIEPDAPGYETLDGLRHPIDMLQCSIEVGRYSDCQ